MSKPKQNEKGGFGVEVFGSSFLPTKLCYHYTTNSLGIFLAWTRQKLEEKKKSKQKDARLTETSCSSSLIRDRRSLVAVAPPQKEVRHSAGVRFGVLNSIALSHPMLVHGKKAGGPVVRRQGTASPGHPPTPHRRYLAFWGHLDSTRVRALGHRCLPPSSRSYEIR